MKVQHTRIAPPTQPPWSITCNTELWKSRNRTCTQAHKSTPTYTAVIHQHTIWRRQNGTRSRGGNLSLCYPASLARCSQGGDLEGKHINKGADSSKGLVLWPEPLRGCSGQWKLPEWAEMPRRGQTHSQLGALGGKGTDSKPFWGRWRNCFMQ